MSSMIGARSGNRGKCAGTCRLPYTLLKDNKEQSKGYLLSSKDVCTLDIIPDLIRAGVKSFKVEGRMKSKEYVGIVTSIYRKYIDLYYKNGVVKIDALRNCLTEIFILCHRQAFRSSSIYCQGRVFRNVRQGIGTTPKIYEVKAFLFHFRHRHPNRSFLVNTSDIALCFGTFNKDFF